MHGHGLVCPVLPLPCACDTRFQLATSFLSLLARIHTIPSLRNNSTPQGQAETNCSLHKCMHLPIDVNPEPSIQNVGSINWLGSSNCTTTTISEIDDSYSYLARRPLDPFLVSTSTTFSTRLKTYANFLLLTRWRIRMESNLAYCVQTKFELSWILVG